ncbi:MAG: RidA family protein [Deltaproteobacteria bacterium]|nr:RidA family protein [Deltaproteobacteria bacterium]
MTLQSITTDKAPKAIGPYSQAVRAGNLMFVSGMLPIDPVTNELKLFDGNAAEQARQVLNNIKALLASQNATLAQVAKTTIFLKNMNDFAAVNEVYGSFFTSHKPARATVEVARLPKDALVEIEAIVVI